MIFGIRRQQQPGVDSRPRESSSRGAVASAFLAWINPEFAKHQRRGNRTLMNGGAKPQDLFLQYTLICFVLTLPPMSFSNAPP